MTKQAVVPVLMRPEEIISLKEAVHRTGKNEKTIRRWCVENGIGRRTTKGAPWEISAVALEAKRYGDEEALEAMRISLNPSERPDGYRSLLGLQRSAMS